MTNDPRAPETAATLAVIRFGKRIPRRRPCSPCAGFLTLPVIVAALSLGPGAPWALAGAHQDLEAIRTQVREFILKQAARPEGSVEVEVGRIDPRLRLSACERPLTLSLPPDNHLAGSALASVRCDGLRPWSLYVTARIKNYGPVLVAVRVVPRGATLGAADVRIEKRDLSTLNDTPLADLKQAAGKLTLQILAPGDVVGFRNLKAAQLVRRGEKVTILASGNGLEVRVIGEALADGTEGQAISVRNSLTRKVIQAVITAPGMVQVRL